MKTRIRLVIPILLLLLAPAALSAEAPRAGAPEQLSSELLLKAAYIYNFAKFVEWPAASFNAPDSPLTIAIVGRDPMAEALKTLEGKEVRGRRIAVFRWEHLEQSAPCHILYIGSSERKNLGAIFKKVAAWDVLTVGAMEEFIHQGGIIMFFLEKNKVRFEINPDMASWKKLHISSHLMRLSRSPEKN